MNPTIDKLMAYAQIAFSVLIFGLVGAVMIIFETGRAHMTVEQLASFDRDVGWLKDAALMVLIFWYQRARQGGIPDPSTQIVTQQHTAADGSKTTITSPATAAPSSVPTLATAVPSGPLVSPAPEKK